MKNIITFALILTSTLLLSGCYSDHKAEQIAAGQVLWRSGTNQGSVWLRFMDDGYVKFHHYTPLSHMTREEAADFLGVKPSALIETDTWTVQSSPVMTNAPPPRTIVSVSFNGSDLLCTTPQWQLHTNWVDQVPTKVMINGNVVSTPPPLERGTVQSNLVAVIEWKGVKHTNVLESVIVTNLTRTFREEVVRRYE